MTDLLHPDALKHLPFFISAPGSVDILMVVMAIILVASILGFGVFFWWLHSLPERMVHHKLQFDIVAALCLLSLFTHIHAFWVAALLLALIKFPSAASIDVLTPLRSIADSLVKMSAPKTRNNAEQAPPALAPIGNAPKTKD